MDLEYTTPALRDLTVIKNARGPDVAQRIFDAIARQVDGESGTRVAGELYRQSLDLDADDDVWYVDFRHVPGQSGNRAVILRVFGGAEALQALAMYW